jgi:heterodisulfide reductase subunit A
MMSEKNAVKIGVFVCDCGSNIRGVVNVPEVVEYAKTLPGVVHAEEGKWICAADFQEKIKTKIRECNLNRVVVACCTPRTHEPLFRETCREAGLNPYLLEFVNIREHCSWVHMHEPEKATEKAKELVKMGVARARFLEPLEEPMIPIGRDCLVIGGGVAGLSAALTLADMGFNVKLVEKEEELGGMLKKLDRVFPYDVRPEEILEPMIKAIYSHKNIEVYTATEVEDLKGYIGNYKVTIRNKRRGSKEEFYVSTIIVATGMKEINPYGYYGYGRYEKVITQLQLEQLLKAEKLEGVKNIVMINCVGSREEPRRYCCRVGCGVSLKNAKRVKELCPEAKIHILYRDLMLFEEGELKYLEEVKGKLVNFVRYSESRKPEVQEKNGKLVVKVYSVDLATEMEIEADLVVLTVGVEGAEGVEKLREMLRASLDSGKFFKESHVKLGPLDLATEGIYVCGCARSPKRVEESIKEAIGAAMKASIPMARGFIKGEGAVAVINPELCARDMLCVKVCPYGAITTEEKSRYPQVISALCKGCGTCAAECPRNAITIKHFTDEQIIAQIDAALSEKPEEKILVFCCNWCSYAAADLAGVSRFQYPPNVRIIRVMCSGRVDLDFIYRAFDKGAGLVVVSGCEFPTCHYIVGNYRCKERMERVRKSLKIKGIDPERLQVVWLSAAEGKKFADLMNEMAEKLKHLNARKAR